MKKLLVANIVVALVVALLATGCTRIPDDVQAIAWNAEVCAHCRMLIGDPAFAAQVITDDGVVRSFDDPGCAARFIREHGEDIHRAWFHAGHGDSWIALADVGFVKVANSPMGSGVIAVARTTPGAFGIEDVR